MHLKKGRTTEVVSSQSRGGNRFSFQRVKVRPPEGAQGRERDARNGACRPFRGPQALHAFRLRPLAPLGRKRWSLQDQAFTAIPTVLTCGTQSWSAMTTARISTSSFRITTPIPLRQWFPLAMCSV